MDPSFGFYVLLAVVALVVTLMARLLLRQAFNRHRQRPYREPALRRRRITHSEFEPDRLEELGVMILETPGDLARGLGLTWKQVVWLTGYFREGERRRFHYHIRTIPKRSGGTRELQAPKKHLRRAQRWVLASILARIPMGNAAHGFVAKRSVRTNALSHVGRDVVVKLDLVNFFPTITYRRVRGAFHSLGYSRQVARILALLCTVPHEKVRNEDGRHLNHRFLPQGAPTSPAISNLVCRRLDARLTGLAAKFNVVYTRYADDLTFSGSSQFAHELPKFFEMVTWIIRREGFAINWAKRRVIRKGSRQSVTGVIVNSRTTLPREERRLLRAIVHRLRTTGDFTAPPEVTDKQAWLRGKLAYYKMIDPEAGEKLWQEYLTKS